MTVKQARSLALSKYKKHKLNSWIVGIACGLFSAAVISLNFLFEEISLLTVPLLVLPFVFACCVFDVGYQDGLDLTFTNFLRAFLSYFKNPFHGSFNVMRSFFKSALIFLICFLVSSWICFYVFQNIYGNEFLDLYAQIVEYLYAGETDMEIIDSIFLSNNGLLMNFILTTIAGPLYLSIMFFVYMTSKNSVSIYLRLKMPKSNSTMVGNVFRRTYLRYREDFRKLYWGLNWPYYLLLLIGFIAGGLLIGFISWDPFRSITCGAMIGFGMTSFFYPFFFSNNLVIHEFLEPRYLDSFDDIIKEIIHRVEVFNDLSPEEKEKIAKNIRETGDPLGPTDKKDDNEANK
mgnify:FL=1